jgi:hypothetical protein
MEKESIRLILVILFFAFLSSSPLWLTSPFTEKCNDKIWGTCVEGKSKLCDTTEFCCNDTIIPGGVIVRNCSETDNNTVIISRCSNGLWIDLNNCTLSQ